MLVLATLTCLGMWGALRLVSFRRLVRWTGTVSRERDVDRAVVDRVVRAVRAVGRHLFPARPCLPQALAARFLLARLGVPTDLRIGVRRAEEGELGAHAWLEREDEVLIGGTDAPVEYHSLTAS